MRENKETSTEISIAEIRKDIKYIGEKIDDLRVIVEKQQEIFLTKAEFKPYQIILGLIGSATLLTALNWFFELVKR